MGRYLVLTVSLVLSMGLGLPSPASCEVDRHSVDRAEQLYRNGQLANAEKLLRQCLLAIDAGQLAGTHRGRCLGTLTKIYRTLRQYDETSLDVAQRYRRFVQSSPTLNDVDRRQNLQQSAIDLAQILSALARFQEAETYLNEEIDRLRKSRRLVDHLTLIALRTRKAQLVSGQGKWHQARKQWEDVYALAQQTRQEIKRDKRSTRRGVDCVAAMVRADREMSAIYARDRDFARARLHLERALRIHGKLWQEPEPKARLLAQRALLDKAEGRWKAAREDAQAAAAIYEALIAPGRAAPQEPARLTGWYDRLQRLYHQLGRYRDAIRVSRELLAIQRRTLGHDAPETYATLSNLGTLYGAIGYYDIAKPVLVNALVYWRAHDPPMPLKVATILNSLAVVERECGLPRQAQVCAEEAVRIRQQRLNSDDYRLAESYSNLASVFAATGRYADAIHHYERAIRIYRKRERGVEDQLSTALLNEAMTFKSQCQLDRASECCREALRVYQQAFGVGAPGTVLHYNALASLYLGQAIDASSADEALEMLNRADQSNRQALDICRQTQLESEPAAATALHHKAVIAYSRSQRDAARQTWLEAIQIQRSSGQKAHEARSLIWLAKVSASPGEAASHYRDALAILERIHSYPSMYHVALCGLAEILHRKGELDEARSLLRNAVQIIEQPRAGTVGAEVDRAEYFAQFASAFDLLVELSLEDGRVGDAFQFAERARSRTFLDQLRVAGVDLRDTLTSEEGKRLIMRERELSAQLARLERQIRDLPPGDPQARRNALELEQQWHKLREQLASVWRAMCDASPLYRQKLTREVDIDLDTLRGHLAGSGSVLLYYCLGSQRSYLLVVAGDLEPFYEELEIPGTARAAQRRPSKRSFTRRAASQLVTRYMDTLWRQGTGRGLLPGKVIADPGILVGQESTHLASILLPSKVRDLVATRKPKNVIIVPDGALHQLPFQALLIREKPRPVYVLDEFPPIAYAPSASILMNLLAWPSPSWTETPFVLTLGNPDYDTGQTVNESATLAALWRGAYTAAAARDGLQRFSGAFPALPKTDAECNSVARAFGDECVLKLTGGLATEGGLRAALRAKSNEGGYRVIHLAAHGLVDQRHDNLFGGIALARGADRAEDDGFLLVHEIHHLPLAGCELAVLSACQTNVGPRRPLEAGSTLAQAFMLAGAKRVICSHWNVADDSTAEMMRLFFAGIAGDLKQARGDPPIDYAARLHEAQTRIRAMAKWASPYYWAPFVLVGPPG